MIQVCFDYDMWKYRITIDFAEELTLIQDACDRAYLITGNEAYNDLGHNIEAVLSD